jgi:hypothetical protein
MGGEARGEGGCDNGKGCHGGVIKVNFPSALAPPVLALAGEISPAMLPA